MKAFKKWWDKVSMEGDWDYERYADQGWKAALEWALSCSTNMIGCKRTINTSEIEEELQE